jgi:hypothetical protein
VFPIETSLEGTFDALVESLRLCAALPHLPR